MIKLDKSQVIGLEPAIRGMRNPLNSWEKSDSVFDIYIRDEYDRYYTDVAAHGIDRELKVSRIPNCYRTKDEENNLEPWQNFKRNATALGRRTF